MAQGGVASKGGVGTTSNIEPRGENDHDAMPSVLISPAQTATCYRYDLQVERFRACTEMLVAALMADADVRQGPGANELFRLLATGCYLLVLLPSQNI
ncbi:hypothetical protein O9K51_05814 [Purpureocillium lavendulum]|uniref:Uncharacterized protein n=1 Tax=Purpureocillium lavendulum TaxID=1247861 RepID=A0AB34FW36_9HYPO|nr:hypothetical protein O9K51_05814 [Purpureocillium lavendulum]